MKGLFIIILCTFAAVSILWVANVDSACTDSASGLDDAGIQGAEDWVVDYINRLRTEPDQALNELGIEGRLRLESHGDMVCTWYGCFYHESETFPLARSAVLDEFAASWAEKMAEKGFFSYQAPDGSRIGDQLTQKGYPSANGTQIISAVLIRDFKDPCQAVQVIMQNLLAGAFAGEGDDSNLQKMLVFQYNSIGVALKPALFTMADGTIVGAYYLVIFLDRPGDIYRSRMIHCGHVYADADMDGLYEDGEGLPGLLFYDHSGAVISRTYREGMFCVEKSAEEWVWHINDRYLPGKELRSVSFWANGEFRQDIDYLEMYLDGE